MRPATTDGLRVRYLVAATIVVVGVEATLGAAVLAWPHPGLGSSATALARVELPGFAGTVAGVRIVTPAGQTIPVSVHDGRLWPGRMLESGERLRVEMTVLRPGWAAWLVGRSVHRRFTVTTPRAQLEGRLLAARASEPVTVSFSIPVSRVRIDGTARNIDEPETVVSVGVRARGDNKAGAVEVAAAARSWERLSTPAQVSWFPARDYPQLLATPVPTVAVAPGSPLRLTFSQPIRQVLGSALPKVKPATPGIWRTLDSHTISFEPAGFGFTLGSTVHVVLPTPAHLAGNDGPDMLTRTIRWHVATGSSARLQQLLAELGYLPLNWQPRKDPPAGSASYQLAAIVSPPTGRYTWRYPNTPRELRALWQPDHWNLIDRAAVMAFQGAHDLPVTGIPGSGLWRAALADAIAGKRQATGYSYVLVHSTIPESLNLWHNGRVILRSPGNTGIPEAPTAPGSYPVFEHIPVGTMQGTNPDGSHYDDPGIQWISYFHSGDAIHAFPRASYGTPQSLGCVELPLDAAATVWPYTPVGTLVTIES
jgi:L,D-transpeptidase catalytic domain